jgi:hypothetical protein
MDSVFKPIAELLKLDNIASVYVGKDDCRCGCGGDYRYASAHRAYSSKHRGYDVGDEEINDRAIKRAFNRFIKHPNEVEVIDDHIFEISTGKDRVWTIYLKEEK